MRGQRPQAVSKIYMSNGMPTHLAKLVNKWLSIRRIFNEGLRSQYRNVNKWLNIEKNLNLFVLLFPGRKDF